MYQTLKNKFRAVVDENRWGGEEVTVKAQTLSPEEAIGNPENDDYPLLKGRERIVEALFRGSRGHAFTDMFGNYHGTLNEVLSLEMKNNFRRAIFIATLNAVLRHTGAIQGTVHCRDKAPPECSRRLVEKIKAEFGNPRIALVGFQPRMAEALAAEFSLKITDLDASNIGEKKFGVVIHGPDQAREHVEWCELLVVTGSTAVNGTMTDFVGEKPVLFYGVTVAGPAHVLGQNRFCPLGT